MNEERFAANLDRIASGEEVETGNELIEFARDLQAERGVEGLRAPSETRQRVRHRVLYAAPVASRPPVQRPHSIPRWLAVAAMVLLLVGATGAAWWSRPSDPPVIPPAVTEPAPDDGLIDYTLGVDAPASPVAPGTPTPSAPAITLP